MISSSTRLRISAVYLGVGQKVPMPPVLGPRSPSKARLWSLAETMGFTVFPSVKASTDTSGPVRYSSTTTRLPEAPKTLSSIRLFTA